MTQEELEKKRKELKAEYHRLERHSAKLAWCNQKAQELGMSYGQFVTWLGI
jgi:ribosomal protein L29